MPRETLNLQAEISPQDHKALPMDSNESMFPMDVYAT